jgi:hypothetical protein
MLYAALWGGSFTQSGSAAYLRPAQAIGAQLSNRAAFGILAKFPELHFWVLVALGRDAGIESDALDFNRNVVIRYSSHETSHTGSGECRVM